MLRIKQQPTFRVEVPLTVPGRPEPIGVHVTFRHKNRLALAEHLAKAPGRDDADVLHDVIESWSGIVDAAGAEVPFSMGSLTDLLNEYSAASGELHRAYLRELTESKRKN